jgi:tetratricopeptide (TPR) repeat protein
MKKRRPSIPTKFNSEISLGKLRDTHHLELVYPHEDITINTPFGDIYLRNCSFNYTVYAENMPLSYDYDAVVELMEKNDYLEAAIELEKKIAEYPKVPIFYQDLAYCYDKLHETGKTVHIIEQNYHYNKGLPIVDSMYKLLQIRSIGFAALKDYKRAFNIYDVYPKQKRFHPDEVRDFYFFLGHCAYLTRDKDLLEKCYETVKAVRPNSAKELALSARLSELRNPSWRLRFAILVKNLIFWGIILFFFWVIYRIGRWLFWG